MLSTLSSKVLDAMNGAVIYIYEGYQQQPIAITQFSWVELNFHMAHTEYIKFDVLRSVQSNLLQLYNEDVILVIL